MKRFIAFLLCLLALSQTASFSSSQTPTEIPIVDINDPSNNPRGLNEIPISAYYLAGTIILSFSDNLGQVDITIEEAADGVIIQTCVNSAVPSAIIPINYGSGDFTITLIASTGAEYIGRFSI